MRTTTKLTLLVMLSVGVLTAVAMTTITSSVNQAYAKKKSCDETKTEDSSCQAKMLNNERYLRGDGNQPTTRSDHGENDSNIVDEQISEDQSEIQLQNSSSITSTLPSITPPEDSHFVLPTM